MKNKYTIFFVSIVIILFGSFACIRVGGLEEDTHKIDLSDAEQVIVDLDIKAGELDIRGGGDRLMDATFSYNVHRWKPMVEYEELGNRGELTIKQGRTGGVPFGDTENKWDIVLGKNIPLEMEIDFGAGEGQLDCREIDLSSLKIDMGVGNLRIDLRGKRTEDMNIDIDAGVGSGTIYLPKDIGVRIRIDGGIGSVDTSGLRKKGNLYINEAYESADIRINIDIDAGVGNIDIIVKNSN